MELVRVERAIAAQWWMQPWADVKAAAEAGTQGMTLTQLRELPKPGPNGKIDDPDKGVRAETQPLAKGDYAYLRKSLRTDGCYLYKQGW